MKGKDRKKYSKVRGLAHVVKGYNSETPLFTKQKLPKTAAPNLSWLSPCLRGRGITASFQAQEYTLQFVAKLSKNTESISSSLTCSLRATSSHIYFSTLTQEQWSRAHFLQSDIEQTY